MGGREGIRGYIAQALVSILSGLRTEKWDAIALEPDDQLEKVDIQWWYGNEFTSCQVKSSVGDFQKSSIVNLLAELISDVPNSSKFILVLLGNSSHQTRKYFAQLTSKNDSQIREVFASAVPLEGKLEVQFNSLNLDDAHGLICHELNRYLSSKGYQVPFDNLELIALGLTAQFSRFATKGSKISKFDFEKDIIKWATFNYPEAMRSSGGGIGLSFYNPETKELSLDKPYLFKLMDICDQKIYSGKVDRLIGLFNDIRMNKLPARQLTNEEIKDVDIPFKIMPTIDMRSMFGERKYAGFKQHEIEETILLGKKIIDMELPDDFFDVGNLEESREYRSAFAFGGNRAFFGNTSEQKKQEDIEEFRWLLKECDDLKSCWDELRDYCILPLVIVNKGNKLHEQIDLQIEIEGEVEILNIENFPYPSDIDNIDLFAEEGGLIEKSCQLKRDSIVKEYDFKMILAPNINFNLPYGKSKDVQLNHLKQVVQRIFDYEFVDGKKDKLTLECRFKNLKPTDNMALPSYLFFKSENAFDIFYSVRSNQGSGYSGNLSVAIEI